MKIDKSAKIFDGAKVAGEVTIGKNVAVLYNAVIRADIGKVSVGDNSNIQDCAVLHCDKDLDLIIGKGVTVGHGAILHSCTVADNCLIGMGAIVLNGVEMGEYSIVGAGSLVTQGTKVEAGSLYLGSPAKFVRKVTEAEKAHIHHNAEEYTMLTK